MKRILLTLSLVMSALSAGAQIISFDMINNNRNTNVKLTLKDAKTEEPISWASVYLIPDGDTTITHFALSDEVGDVLLKEVPVGKYELNAEMIGYNPHKKVYTIKANWQGYDLGIIKLEENPEYIDAAQISAVGNPITVKQDTIEFNASSFKVAEHAMLEDLLKKMPGMEVSEDGTVTLNGEAIDKITVGGKTFFFNDPTAALRNLPAKIVDKIKVIDKTKDEVAGSGIVGKDDKEKVMDVELKEEYTKGWYGNAKVGGGTTLTPSGKADVDDRGALYNGNAMVTGYTEKDQLVLIGNAFNVIEPGASVGFFYRIGDDPEEKSVAMLEGLPSTAQVGANYNTSRIKGMETTANVNYKNNGKVGREVSSRTSFMADEPDLQTDRTYDATGSENGISGNLEMKAKDNDKYYLTIRPSISYITDRINTNEVSETKADDVMMNSSNAMTASTSSGLSANINLYGGFNNLGKDRRSLTFYGTYYFNDSERDSHELSEIKTAENTTVKDLLYNSDISGQGITAGASYSEPLAERWTAQIRISSNYINKDNKRHAFNPDGSANEYYSSMTDNTYMNEQGVATIQYSNDTSTVQFGARFDGTYNEIRAKSLGTETHTGKGDWMMNWTPYLSYAYRKNTTNLYLDYHGYSNRPSSSSIIPALDISNPVQITAGNVYLKPGYTHMVYGSFRTNNRETFSFLNVSVNGNIATRSTVYASWFDKSGVRYAIPVNSMKPQSNASAYVSYNRPLGKERRFTLSASGRVSYSGGCSYQATGTLAGLDLQDFDYNDFMREFWGDASGNRFYSGESGFSESRTNTVNWRAEASLKYSIDKLDAKIGATVANRISRYSLDPTANMNTWNNRINANILYHPGRDWTIDTDFNYIFYRGYASGFGSPEWNWDITISKSIKAFNLKLIVADILNQTRSLERTVSAEYVEDVYTNVLGRYFLFSVTFNFGKMNAKKNRSVERAMFNMM